MPDLSYMSHMAYTSNTNFRPRTTHKCCATQYPNLELDKAELELEESLRVTLPIPKPIEAPAPPIPTPVPRAVQSLPEPVVQLQERTLPQHHVPAALPPLVHPTPASITQAMEP